jgi:Protein of unknown function (DUF1549)/Protein of unknown function (DUF1553)/Planctomycete cytochrome C
MRPCRSFSLELIAIAILLVSASASLTPVAGQENTIALDQSPATVDYVKDVRPILRANCATCHNEAQPEGGLRLDLASEMIKGGDSGLAIEPGKGDESLLIRAVMQTGDLKMPPPDEAKPLGESQIEILRRWIDEGANVPKNESQISHWSFRIPVRPAVPVIAETEASGNENSASRTLEVNPIDAFLAQSHRQKNLNALPLAPKHILLRRVYLDLIGLPPTPEQLQSFLNDESTDAWEKVVDELLASPHYGERWGRHWMDVWRYSDWDGHGAEVRESKPHIWRWRDWIIESLNEDKPYDRMIMEMLAADEIAPDDAQAIRATGYLVRNWYLFNRNTWIDNTIEHTGKAFLGITFNCARCHDHMYDPISQAEYYQLRAFFEPHDVRTDRLPSQPDVTKDGLVRVFDAHANAQTLLFVRGDEKRPLKDKPLEPRVPASLGARDLTIQSVNLPASAYYPGLQRFIATEALGRAEAEAHAASLAHTAAEQALEKSRSELLAFQTSPTLEPNAPVLKDDFSEARPEIWVTGTGTWQYREGHLSQLDPADTMCMLKALPALPSDFSARLKFRTTGGDVYQSVGIAFDVIDDQNFSFVYASTGGSKIQVAHRVNGTDQYPATGMKDLPVELNREHELLVVAKGKQLEVTFNGELVVTYLMPSERPTQAQFSLWTYDATAELLALEVTSNAVLSEAGLLASLQQAESAARLAERKQQFASAALDAVRACIAADQANYLQPPAANCKELSLAAGQAERTLALRQEELNLLTAEQALQKEKAGQPADGSPIGEAKQKSIADAEAAVLAAKNAVEAAQKSAAEPFEAYTRLTTVYPATSTGRRSALARWIASRDNPLTARVAVNHIWLRHFHQPLVPTLFDFGLNGMHPSHPELLDWLACELMDSGWKMKPLHRLIATSEAYRRLSSAPNELREVASSNAQLDPENHQLWRQNSYRMEAEIVRDATLHIAGKLDTTMFGPDIDPNAGLTLGRRSLYFRNSKEKKMTFLATFDSPNPVECYRRPESISPQQSLAMSNSPLTLTQSRNLAAELIDQLAVKPKDETSHEFVILAFQRVLNRKPDTKEMSTCTDFLQQQTDRYATGSPLTAFPGGTENLVTPSSDAAHRARENLIHVLLNHNDFVTVR